MMLNVGHFTSVEFSTGLAMFTAMDPNRFLSGGHDDIRTGDLDSHSHLWGLKRIEATDTTLLMFIPFNQMLHRIWRTFM